MAPDVNFTCTSNGSDRLLDYAIASKELAEFIQARPFYDHPFRPHICGVDYVLSLDLEIDSGMTLAAPKEIEITYGPRQVDDTWWHDFNKFEGFQPTIEALEHKVQIL